MGGDEGWREEMTAEMNEKTERWRRGGEGCWRERETDGELGRREER